ncbi:MAG: DUF4412 domain-containing protein [Nitrospirae bacterium]|nr:DUF4412 domain-containing protein [Nitrospirota bacterium]
MKKTGVLSAVLLSVSLLVSSAAGAGPGTLKNYSADMETTTSKGSFTSKIYYKDTKMRMENNNRGQSSVNILRPDKKVMWMLMKDSKSYMEMQLDKSQQDIQSKLQDPNIKTEKEFVANEVVDKHPTKKYHVTTIIDGKKEKAGHVWEASDLNNFPVKYQSEDGKITTVWKNIKSGGVTDDVFEVPAGYKKMDMPQIPGFGGGPKKQKQ